MGIPVAPTYQVIMSWLLDQRSLDCTKYVSNVSVNHEIQTLSPTFSISFSENLYKYEAATPNIRDPIDGSETFSIYMGYGGTLVPMLVNGTISTFSRTLTKNGVEFVVNGRGPMARLIDEGPELDQIYIPTWDKSYSKEGYWVNSACGIQRTEPTPPGIDPNQDPDEYEIFEGDWFVSTILNDIISNVNSGAAAGSTIQLVVNIPDAKYREVFRFNRTQTWISAIQQLVSVWEPLVFMRDNKLYILDTDVALPESSNIGYGPSSCSVVNFNYTKNAIVNRVIIKGGTDESVVPEKHETWVPNIDTIQQFIGEDLGGLATEITASEHPTPSSIAGGFTGARVYTGYYKPMFGDPLHVYTRTIDYHRDNIMKVKLELKYYRTSGTFGPDQQVCTKVFKKRTQEFVVGGYYTSEATPVWVSLTDLSIVQGYVGPNSTGTDAADPQGQSILPVYFGWGADYIKVLDAEEIYDTEVGSTLSAATSRTFGILPKGPVMSTISPDEPSGDRYYLVGGAPIIDPRTLWERQKINGYTLSYRILYEKVVISDASSSSFMAFKQTNLFDYTKMVSDTSAPEVTTTTEAIPINLSLNFKTNKKPIYQYQKYYEDLPSINDYGYKAVVTYYDPSIFNDTQSGTLWNKIRSKSGRAEQELVIRLTIGNPLLSVGKSLVLESATYKQANFELWEYTKGSTNQLYHDAVVSGGDFIVNGIRHSFDKENGFKTEVSLRKLWKLLP